MSLTVFIFALLVIASAFYILQSRKKNPRPPGPSGLPVLGNALALNARNARLKFTHWNAQFGEIVYLRVFSRSMLLLNSLEAATELLEKRSSIYSDRPSRTMAKLSGFDVVTTFRERYDDSLRMAKKFLHAEFSRANVSGHSALQEQRAHEFCALLQERPGDFLQHIRETTMSISTLLFYGHEEVFDDYGSFKQNSLEVLHQFNAMAAPSRYLVDSLPFLRYIPAWVPGAVFQSDAAQNRRRIHRYMNEPYLVAKRQITNGAAQPSFLSNLLTRKDLSPEEEMSIKYAAGSGWGAGFETTVALLMTFFIAMVLYPEVQARAQAELDAAIGNERMPTFSDRKILPYIDCIVSELMRWRPPIPFAWRALRQDDNFRGYVIPKGTLVTVNTLALTHDKNWYPDPDEFKPTRFLDADGNYSVRDAPDPRRLTFGFGRRSCPGVHFADSVLFIIIASTLASVSISPEVSENGEPLLPDVPYAPGMGGICQPPPFKCTITPRERHATNPRS
ncbi:cytochrome P450 [Lentinus tigrinus ALCF2SS1-7]|uniref:Cytochrome P450 n=1 Tax=Lentinus tigrinus ALCF2SS1-6 TaxID=1328759 RepID=A0A5C2RS22_9APHY|nr:cytochrome P450 [Lentinus tigrinus ALCF2SS1-6]RPD73208.1 cytochrome P450 [Lentinus tigrinus ALCF2SS1-7]